MDTEKTICEKCTGETVINGYCHNCGDGEKPEVEEDEKIEEVLSDEEII